VDLPGGREPVGGTLTAVVKMEASAGRRQNSSFRCGVGLGQVRVARGRRSLPFVKENEQARATCDCICKMVRLKFGPR